MINWKVRFKNKLFWVSFVSAVLLVIQALLSLFGVNINIEGLNSKLIVLIEAVFAVLSVLGVVTDFTTSGVGDSAQALTYEKPRE